MADFLAIREDAQTRSLAIFLATAVVEDCQHAAMIRNPVEAEKIPCAIRHKRVDLDHVIGTRTQANEAGDNEIAESRVVVVLATLDAAFRRGPTAGIP